MSRIKQEILLYLGKLANDLADKSPLIFGSGFENTGLKCYSIDDEMVIPGAMCINSYILNALSDYKTVRHIEKYMEEDSKRPPTVGSAKRSTAIILMLSCVKYTFNASTFPACNDAEINQMWADVVQMTKGDHVCCTIVAVATRGRSHVGFTKEHAPRRDVPPVSVLEIPRYAKPGLTWSQPPPPPPRAQSDNSSQTRAQPLPPLRNQPLPLPQNQPMRTQPPPPPPERRPLPKQGSSVPAPPPARDMGLSVQGRRSSQTQSLVQHEQSRPSHDQSQVQSTVQEQNPQAPRKHLPQQQSSVTQSDRSCSPRTQSSATKSDRSCSPPLRRASPPGFETRTVWSDLPSD